MVNWIGRIISLIIVLGIEYLIGLGLYQFIQFPIMRIIFYVYRVVATIIGIFAIFFFTDPDNLI